MAVDDDWRKKKPGEEQPRNVQGGKSKGKGRNRGRGGKNSGDKMKPKEPPIPEDKELDGEPRENGSSAKKSSAAGGKNKNSGSQTYREKSGEGEAEGDDGKKKSRNSRKNKNKWDDNEWDDEWEEVKGNKNSKKKQENSKWDRFNKKSSDNDWTDNRNYKTGGKWKGSSNDWDAAENDWEREKDLEPGEGTLWRWKKVLDEEEGQQQKFKWKKELILDLDQALLNHNDLKDLKVNEETGEFLRPDREEFDIRIENMQNEVDERRKHVEEFEDRIAKRGTDEDYYNIQRQDLEAELKAKKEEREAQIKKKHSLQDEVKATKALGAANATKIKEMERKKQQDKSFMSEEKINAKLQEIEYLLNVRTRNLTLKQEKDYMAEMKKLKSLKPEAVRFARELAMLKNGGPVGGKQAAERAEQLKKLDRSINDLANDIWSQEQVIKKHEKEVKNLETTGSGTTWEEKRDRLQQEVDKLSRSKTWLISEKRRQQKQYGDFMDDERERKRLAYEEEQVKWRWQQEVNRARRELVKTNPVEEELEAVARVVQYCKGLASTTQSEQDPRGFNNQQDPRNQDPRGGEFNNQQDIRGTKYYSNRPLSHSHQKLNEFHRLSIEPPQVEGEVQRLYENLTQRQQRLQERSRRWEMEKESRLAHAQRVIDEWEVEHGAETEKMRESQGSAAEEGKHQ